MTSRTGAPPTGAGRRSSGRPRAAVLTRELILRTALRLLDERGEQGAGMRDLARELSVRPSALYNHVSGYDDLLDGVRELVSDRIDVSGFGELQWDAAIDQWARSYRSAFAAHPPTIALMAVRPLLPGTRTGRMYDAVCRGLIEAGWPESQVLPVIVALECFILGAALDDTAPIDMLDPGSDPDVPHFRLAYDARAAELDDAQPSDASFELGLAAMLTGLRAQFEALTSSPQPSALTRG